MAKIAQPSGALRMKNCCLVSQKERYAEKSAVASTRSVYASPTAALTDWGARATEMLSRS